MLNFLIFLFPIGLLLWQLQDICTATKLSSPDVCELSGNYLLYWIWGLFMETQFTTYSIYLFSLQLGHVTVLI